jgi:hypothetical protein
MAGCRTSRSSVTGATDQTRSRCFSSMPGAAARAGCYLRSALVRAWMLINGKTRTDIRCGVADLALLFLFTHGVFLSRTDPDVNDRRQF